MNRITQEAKKRQAVVKYARRKGKSAASRMYGVSLSSVKRWDAKYAGTWKSSVERSHRPHSHPKRHINQEEEAIARAFGSQYERYGWDGVYDKAVKAGYGRSFSGMVYAAKRIGLVDKEKKKKPLRKHDRRYPELRIPEEPV